MSLGIETTGQTYPAIRPTVQDRFTPSSPTDPPSRVPAPDRVELSTGVMPANVLAQIDRAHQRALELAAEHRELHFTTDRENGRVIVQVRDLDGNILRTIPNEKALEILSGEEL